MSPIWSVPLTVELSATNRSMIVRATRSKMLNLPSLCASFIDGMSPNFVSGANTRSDKSTQLQQWPLAFIDETSLVWLTVYSEFSIQSLKFLKLFVEPPLKTAVETFVKIELCIFCLFCNLARFPRFHCIHRIWPYHRVASPSFNVRNSWRRRWGWNFCDRGNCSLSREVVVIGSGGGSFQLLILQCFIPNQVD